ncbi:MAG: hypothetical protein ACR2NM_00845 [Bythopirellula sp.]
MAWLIPLIIQIVSGAGGGNLVGKILKNIPISKILQTVLGGVGGGLGGLLLSVLGVDPAAAGDVAEAAGGMDMGGVLGDVLGGGAGGGLLVAIVGMIKKMMGGAGAAQ